MSKISFFKIWILGIAIICLICLSYSCFDPDLTSNSNPQPFSTSPNQNPLISSSSIGTIKNPVIDSQMSWDEAIKHLDKLGCPPNVIQNQRLITVKYWSYDNKVHQGQLVLDARLVKDVETIFEIALQEKFPIQSAIPISFFDWDDKKSMAQNNTSGFNYRKATGGLSLSKHAFGFAIDINPLCNPYVKGQVVLPQGAKYNQLIPGTLTPESSIVKAFIKFGWKWGGHWKTIKDYQHFEKELKEDGRGTQ